MKYLLLMTIGSFLSITQVFSAENDFICKHPRYQKALSTNLKTQKNILEKSLPEIVSLIEEIKGDPKLKVVPQDMIDSYVTSLSEAQKKNQESLVSKVDIAKLVTSSIAPTSPSEEEAVSVALFKNTSVQAIYSSIPILNAETTKLSFLSVKKKDPNEALAAGIAERIILKKLFETMVSNLNDERLSLLKACAFAQKTDNKETDLIENLKGKICVDTEKVSDRKPQFFEKTLTTKMESKYPIGLTSMSRYEVKEEALKECTKAALFDCTEIIINCEDPIFKGLPGVYGKVSRTCTSTVRGYETKKITNITKQCIDLNNVSASLTPIADGEKPSGETSASITK